MAGSLAEVASFRMFEPGASLSPSGWVVMARCGRRGRILYRKREKKRCTWCGGPVESPRRTWCSEQCVEAYDLTQPAVLVSRVLDRDMRRDRDGLGYHVCSCCAEERPVEVDHRIPIVEGGHPFDLANLRLLCSVCHTRETAALARRRARYRRACAKLRARG
jgi:5-methylcytosine-specific restriction endonuclease McrA